MIFNERGRTSGQHFSQISHRVYDCTESGTLSTGGLDEHGKYMNTNKKVWQCKKYHTETRMNVCNKHDENPIIDCCKGTQLQLNKHVD